MRRRTEKSSTIIKKKYHPSSRRYIYETITFEDVKIAGKNMIGRFLLIFRFQLSVLGKHLNFSFRQFDNQELNIRRKKIGVTVILRSFIRQNEILYFPNEGEII